MKAAYSRLLVILSVVMTAGTSWGQLPDPRTVEFTLYTERSNPSSPVEYAIYLQISPEEADGDDIGWRIDSIFITKFYTEGKSTWRDDAPTLSTPDGLWWVTHANPQSPVFGEFTDLPAVSGEGAGQDQDLSPLDYNLSVESYAPESSPFENAAMANYWFENILWAIPVDEGDDEPVEIEENPSDPS